MAMQLSIFEKENAFNITNHQTVNDLKTINRVPGLQYVPDFITPNEQKKLWQSINKETWLTELKRRVQHYGWKYDYKARAIDSSMYLGELPDWAQSVAERLYKERYLPNKPDQLIVNEYEPGQGIANHVDCEPCFGSTIVTISMGSQCVMDFINLNSREKIEVLLEQRSLAVLSGEARYNWTHGIAARKTDNFKNVKTKRNLRISMTFRNVIVDA
ncbi:MAG: alpha-ketoglutarate-dependent dioxygenase AlkB [Flavobacteriales bacterium]